MLYEHHMRLLYKHVADPACPALADAMVLLRMWIRQRGLESSGFSGCVASFLLVELLEKNTIPKDCSSFQLLRAAFSSITDAVRH